MNRTLVAALILVTAAESVAQRIDVGVGGFQALAQTQTQFSPPYLVLITSGQAGGAQRCFDLAGPLVAFGGTGFVPNLLNGQLNRGRGTIGITPFTGLQCKGTELPFVPAAPAFDDSTRRDVEFEMTFNGTISSALSIRFEIRMATTSANPFQLCFRAPWMTLIEGAPDLDPDIEVYAGGYGLVNPGVPGEQFIVQLEHRLRSGDWLPRGKMVVFIVYVVNHGTWFATGWTAQLHLPTGWKQVFELTDCVDFSGGNPPTHRGKPLAVGATVRLCAAFRPAGASTTEATVITAVAGDSNPSNDQAFGSIIDAEPPRIAQPLATPTLPLGGGRRR